MTNDPKPTTDGHPVFDQGLDDLPWVQDEVLPVDDDGNVLPSDTPEDDDDPNDDGRHPDKADAVIATDPLVIDRA